MSKPYGPAYQQACAKAALKAGCKGNTMGLLYCLFHQTGLFDWDTGQTVREISHKDLGAAMGGLNYDTVRRSLRELREAGILGYADYRGRAVVWSDGTGFANRYKLLLPPLGGGEKTTRPPVEKQPAPRAKNAHHYHDPSLPRGKKGPPSRRQDAPSRPQTPEEQGLFDQWLREGSYGDAVYQLKRWREQQGAEVE